MIGKAITILFSVLVIPMAAQWDPRGVRTTGMVGCSDTTLWIGQGNPSAASLRGQGSVSVSYLPGLFGLSELRRWGIAAGVRSGTWGGEVHLLSYGASLFQMRSVWATVSRTVSTSSAVGLQLGAHRWSTGMYPDLWEWGYGVGFLVEREGLLIGARIRSIGTDLKDARVELCTGLTVEVASAFALTAELMQESGKHLMARYAIAVTIVESFDVVCGWQDDPHMVGFGCTVRLSDLEMSFGGNWHGVLGWTHAIGMGIRL